MKIKNQYMLAMKKVMIDTREIYKIKPNMNIITINSFQTYGDGFGDYCQSKGICVEHYSFSKRPRSQFQSKCERVVREIVAFFKLFTIFPKIARRKIYCTGEQLGTLAFFRLFKFLLGKNGHLYIHNFYMHGLGKNRYVKMVLSWLFNNERVTLICQSPNEMAYYKELTNKCHLTFVPYCSDILPPSVGELSDNSQLERYIFSGGYTNRDYELIGELAARHPEQSFLIVASSLNKNVDNLPRNVVVKKDIPNNEFERYLSNSIGVIVALKEDVGSSGQMLTISAMRNKKPIIYTDIQAINYYFTLYSGCPYVLGDIESLDNAYRRVFSNYEDAKKMGEIAFVNSRQFTLDSCYRKIYEIVFMS